MNHIRKTRNLNVFPLLLLAVLGFAAASAPAQSGEVLTLDIPPQEAGSALFKLAKSSGKQIMLAGGPGVNVEVRGLQGEYRLEEALAALLTETGLEYEMASEDMIVVRRAAAGADEDGADEEEQKDGGEEEEALELGEQVVTGSRLAGGDPSALVYSITAEEIARRGIPDLEEFFRTLPWHFSTTNTQTGMWGSTDDAVSRGEVINWPGSLDVGVATANLRGLGSRNTLVLRDGRRIAGVGGVEQDIVNLLDVPLASIERVDIQLDGASAVYGADAIGGVVNFITKKRYQGLAASARQEFSSTGANSSRASVTGGYAWGGGKVTASISHSTSEPVINKKTGWTTRDLRYLLGPDFDRRRRGMGQPGVACFLHPRPQSSYSIFPTSPQCSPIRDWSKPREIWYYYQLPPDHSGENAQPSDFAQLSGSIFDLVKYDEVPPQNGRFGTRQSLDVSVEQELTGNLNAYLSVNWVRSDSYMEYVRAPTSSWDIPASNAYNPFGRAVRVDYVPTYEFDNGLLPPPHESTSDESRSINAGFYWKIFARHELNLDINRTKSWRSGFGFRVSPNRNALGPTAKEWFEALASPDPAIALNVFGNGTVQGSAFGDFLVAAQNASGATETRQYNISLRGELFRMWGGPATYAAGGEYRQNIIFHERNRGYEFVEWLDPEIESLFDGSYATIGVRRPSRDTEAYYAEFAFPFFGKDNQRPGVRSLILTAQARFDVDDAAGAFGGRERMSSPARYHFFDVFQNYAPSYNEGEYPHYDYSNSKLANERNTRMSPRLGLQYKPVDTLTFRASWSRSYIPPTWSQRFGTREPRWSGNYYGVDPLAPGGPRKYEWWDEIRSYYTFFSEGLEAEFSTHWMGSLEWAPAVTPGLRVRLDWSAVDYNNRITFSQSWVDEFPEVVLADPLIGVRDDDGNLTSVIFRNINLHNKYSEMANVHAEYAFATRFGRFTPGVKYMRYLDDYDQLVADTPKISNLGTQRGQNRYTWQFSLRWQWRAFEAELWAYYTPGYINERAHRCPLTRSRLIEGSVCTGSWEDTRQYEYLQLDVSSLTTMDLTLGYQFNNGIRLRIGGRNVLDRPFPRTVNSQYGYIPYDAARWNARGRVLFADLNWQM